MTTWATYKLEVDWDNTGLYDNEHSDVTAYVNGNMSWNYGRDRDSQLVGRWTSFSFEVELDNFSNIFSRLNSGSDLYGKVLPGRKVKLTMTIGATPYVKFVGRMSSMSCESGVIKGESRAIMKAVGSLAWLQDRGQVNVPLQTDVKTGAAMEAVLDSINWPDAERDIDAGQSTLPFYWAGAPADYLNPRQGGTNDVLQSLHDIEDTEAGFLREKQDGKICFEDRIHRFSGQHMISQKTYTNALTGLPGTVRYSTISPVDTFDEIFNVIQATIRVFDIGQVEQVLWQLANIYDQTNPGHPLEVGPGETVKVNALFPNGSSGGAGIAAYVWTTVNFEANTEPDGVGGTDKTDQVVIASTALEKTGKSKFDLGTMKDWEAETAFSVGDRLIDYHNYVQECTVAGDSGTDEPTWSTTLYGTTVDGDVTWKNIGPYDVTYSTQAELQITNNDAGTVYLIVLQALGIPLIEGDGAMVSARDDTADGSIERYGERVFPFPGKFITSREEAQSFCDYLLSIYKHLRLAVTLQLEANVNSDHLTEVAVRDVSDRITIVNDEGLNLAFFVERISHTVKQNGIHTMSLLCSLVTGVEWSESDIPYTPNSIPATSGVPNDLYSEAYVSGLSVITQCAALKYNASVDLAEFRAKFYAAGSMMPISADLRTVAEGGTLVHNGTTELVVTDLTANFIGCQYPFTSAADGRWYYAWRLRNTKGWSVWTDGNGAPQYVVQFVDTEVSATSDTGPPADWNVSVNAGPRANTVMVTVTRPATNGKKLQALAIQVKDGSTGSWRAIDADAGAADTLYDGSAVNHTYDPAAQTLTKGTSGWGTAAEGDLLLLDVRGSTFDKQYCQWMVLGPGSIGTDTLSGIIGFRAASGADLTEIRIKIVKPPWAWNTEGYFGDEPNMGLWAEGPDAPGLKWDKAWPGMDTTSAVFVAGPIEIPPAVDVADVEARAWFQNLYSRGDDDTHSSLTGDALAAQGWTRLQDADPITADCANGGRERFYCTLDTMGATRELANFTNLWAGQKIDILFKQPPTPDFEVFLEMADCWMISSNTAYATFLETQMAVDVGNYDEIQDSYFEVVARNNHASNAYSVHLKKVGGSVVASISVPANTPTAATDKKRFRSSAFTLATGTYVIEMDQTAASQNLTASKCGIVIVQGGNATKTCIQIPLTGVEFVSGGTNGYYNVAYSYSATYEQSPTDSQVFSIYKKTESDFATIAGWIFEVVHRSWNASYDSYVSLFNATTGNQITDSELTTKAIIPTLQSVDLDNGATEFTDGDSIEVRHKSSHGTFIYRTALYVKLTSLSKGKIYKRVNKGSSTIGAGDLVTLESRQIGLHGTYFEGTGYKTDAGQVHHTYLRDDGSNENGDGGTNDAASDLQFGTTKEMLRSGALTCASGNRFIAAQVIDSGAGYHTVVNLFMLEEIPLDFVPADLTYDTKFRFRSASPVGDWEDLTDTPNAVDLLHFVYNGLDDKIEARSIEKGYGA